MDWDSRVGSFTYDQAIAELGPPDSQRSRGDGKTAAVWANHRWGGSSFSVGGGGCGGNTAVGVGHAAGSGRPDRVLRLTFDAQGRLAAWSKNY